MKLIALKDFSKQLQAGQTFEVPDQDGQALIHMKVAKLDETASPAPQSRRSSHRRHQADHSDPAA